LSPYIKFGQIAF